ERDVQAERARRDRLDVVARAGVAEPHDRALAELFLDLSERGGERLLAILFHSVRPRCVSESPAMLMRHAGCEFLQTPNWHENPISVYLHSYRPTSCVLCGRTLRRRGCGRERPGREHGIPRSFASEL